MHSDTKKYNGAQVPIDRAICQLLADQIDRNLPEATTRYGTPILCGFSMATPSSDTAS
jgi:hypothetical protein